MQNGKDAQAEAAETITKPVASDAKAESIYAVAPSIEQTAQKQTQEAFPTENTNTPSTSERGRRRQGQERQKDQPVTTSTTDTVSSTTESDAQLGEVAPEDLPPLE